MLWIRKIIKMIKQNQSIKKMEEEIKADVVF